MIFLLFGLGLFFLAIGYLVTENNAKYLLAGYNTMSEEERKRIDIRAYIPYFRKFHLFLGLSFVILGALVLYVLGEEAGSIFLGVYPIAAYLYFLWSGSKYLKGAPSGGSKAGTYILAAVLVVVIGLFISEFKENRLVFNEHQLEFDGIYGETIAYSRINNIELTDALPELTIKKNGFAAGAVKKGYFKTKDGEVVKLILNTDQKPYILITTTEGKKIYYSAKNADNTQIHGALTALLHPPK